MQCMLHLVHCPSAGISVSLDTHFPLNQSAKSNAHQLAAPIDRSIQTSVPKRLLAQRLVELPGTCKALLEALSCSPETRSAALVVLMHCCQLNAQLSIAFNKVGLIKRLLLIADTAGLSKIDKVCFLGFSACMRRNIFDDSGRVSGSRRITRWCA